MGRAKQGTNTVWIFSRYHPWTKACCLLRASFMSPSTEGSLSLRAQGFFLTSLDHQSHPSWDLCGWLDTLTDTQMKERQLGRHAATSGLHMHIHEHIYHTQIAELASMKGNCILAQSTKTEFLLSTGR